MSDFAYWCRDCEEYADTFKVRLSGEHFCRKCETACGLIPDVRPLEFALTERDKRIAELETELRIAWEDDCNCAPVHMDDCPARRQPELPQRLHDGDDSRSDGKDDESGP